ncbi:MAG: hypothetical protein M1839_004119 [Geoglossum umbratile]|nr:MAG: hypothetical protein M1839_004119 [Geoglossum umbratile]
MAPKPRRHKPQTQPITTTLANILRDYHAGTTVLRELLQNADDAGATKIDFHLHAAPSLSPSLGEPHALLHPSLLEFQGPALLAHNNHPPFRPQDFESLSHVGDSGKRNDPTKTGKFGLGFNSVYNWTDGPSVLSGENLLLLDPHHGWSAELGTPGGPIYDFVADGETDEMRNQLKPFAEVLVNHDFRRPLDGTVVRIPLRTEAQAQRSRICQRSTGIEEIRKVIEGFAISLGEGYGVFLRRIKEVGIWEGGERIGGCEIVDTIEVDRARSAINEAYNDVFVTRSKDEFEITFEMKVKVDLPGGDERGKSGTWVVQHLMQRDVGVDLTEWGMERKLFGWGLPLGNFTGGLFTVLPLSKSVGGHPVHLHGLFSITSDRANLHSASDGSDPNPFLWNKMLFDSLFPVAWTKLLRYLCRARPQRNDLMHFWPKDQAVVDGLGKDICRKVFEHVADGGLELFFTGQGFVDIGTALFVKIGDVDQGLQGVLNAVGMPVVYLVPQQGWIFELVLTRSPSRLLTPRALCDFLRFKDSVGDIGAEAKAALLEYILSNMDTDVLNDIVGALSGIPLFRLGNGSYHAIGSDSPRVFICLNEFEELLFRRWPDRNLDCSLLSTDAITLLRRLALDHDDITISTYSVEDFVDYCLETVFSGIPVDVDVIPHSSDHRQFIDEAWTWIRPKWSGPCSRWLKKLWLIPLHGGYLRRPYVDGSTVPTLHAVSGPTGELLLKLTALNQQSTPPPVLDEEALCTKNRQFLISCVDENGKLLVGSCEKLSALLPWLVAGKEMILAATSRDKMLTLATIAAKFKGEMLAGTVDTAMVTKALSQLPLFMRVRSDFVDGEMYVLSFLNPFSPASMLTELPASEQIRSWTDNSGEAEALIGFSALPFVPSAESTSFIYTEDEHVKDMLTETGMAKWPTTAELVERYLLPTLTHDTCNLLPGVIKVEAVELIFRNYFSLSEESRASVCRLPIVPTEGTSLAGEELRFYSINQLLHPTAREIDELFFLDEQVYPRKSLFDQFGGVMLQCGLRWKLTWAVALDRIRLYAGTDRPLKEVAACVEKLFQLQIAQGDSPSPQDLKEVGDLAWIPVRDGRRLERRNPLNCRSARDWLLVGRVLPVLGFEVHSTWQCLLGWHASFPASMLAEQLQAGAADGDFDIVNAVLTYITERGLQKSYVDVLRQVDCILGSGGTLFPPTKVFSTGAAKLCPYLGDVHKGFWKRHHRLIAALDLPKRPTLHDLLQVQKKLLVLEQPLSEADLAVAIEVVNLASEHDREKLVDLRVPDQFGRLQDFESISFWDLEFSSARETAQLVHPNITEEVTARLGIQPFSEKMLMGEMGVRDQEDEDEFFQHETTTTRIADTLGRYPISATFNEYLANAEDSGTATRVEWLLDECLNGGYPTERLLSKDLAEFQGQALFVHNDGVFLDGDFEGFRNVGRGSKREATWAIGQFGRGAQTMYHWTDVPMLISGRHYLVLDPQQKFLPLNRRHGRRKPGLKVELAKIRDVCCDQLAPFHGLWGYSQDMDNYEGTIFRFPLRPRRAKTALTESKVNLDAITVRDHLESYFQTARLSLLFLQRIRQVSFRLRHMKEPRFRVEYAQRLFPLLCTQPYRYISVSYLYRDQRQRRVEGIDEWWIAKNDIREVPAELRDWQEKVRRRVKDSKCGIALLCTPPRDSMLGPQMFSTLPLPFASHLPVHINASFILSGDRQSILVGGSSPFEGSAWNRWLLRESIPELYLNFLEQIVRRFGTEMYNYWPTREESKDGPSDLVREGFWAKVASSRNRLYQKAVRAVPARVPDAEGQGRKLAKSPDPPVRYELREAVFDFISATSSPMLQDIFLEWFPNLVRVPGDELPMDFRMLGLAITELTSSMIRKRLQDPSTHGQLQEYADGDSGVIDDLLQLILPRRGAEDSEVAGLNGCPVLPLQDGSLGTLHYLKVATSPPMYFCVTAEEREIFGFASNLFVRGEVRHHPSETSFYGDGVGKDFTPWVLNSSSFNVRELLPSDLGRVLQQRDASEWESTPALESWLETFWFYFRMRMPKGKLKSSRKSVTRDCGIDKFPVYQATKGGRIVHISPENVEKLPTIIEPPSRLDGLLELCQRFPDLYIINRAMTPFSLEEPETEASFYTHFLAAIADIASAKKISVEAVVLQCADDASRKTLLSLTLTALFKPDFASTFAPPLRSVIESLPIWPTMPGHYVTSSNALTAGDDRLVVPWLRHRNRFIEHTFLLKNKGDLAKLGVNLLTTAQIFQEHILHYIPIRLQPEHMPAYSLLIQAMAALHSQEKETASSPEDKNKKREGMIKYSESRLAADADGVMHYPRDLYDHDDKVYKAAYGLESVGRFLHPSVRCYREFWVAMGIRGGNWKDISGSEYRGCLLSLDKRIKQLGPSTSLTHDIRQTLQGLTRVSPTTLAYDKNEIISLPVVPTNADFTTEPSFRKLAMTQLCGAKPYISLSEAIHSEHIPVCWTQVPFPLYNIYYSDLDRFSLSARPPVKVVWDHLKALVEISAVLQDVEVKKFLDDLSRTYRYLQQEPTTDPIPDLAGKKYWLNIDASDVPPRAHEINSSWMDVDHMVLFCPYDPGELKYVRSYLTPLETLLTKCGCQPIRNPTWKKPEGKQASGPTMTEVSRLWKDQRLTDVVFSAEGEQISAHKLILAAASKYCEVQFTGPWSRSNSAETPIEIEGMAHSTLTRMITFAYTDELDWKVLGVAGGDTSASSIADKLDILLDLLAGADRWDMSRLHSVVETYILDHARTFVRIDNVTHIEEIAREIQAKDLASFCSEYRKVNSTILAVVEGDTGGDDEEADETVCPPSRSIFSGFHRIFSKGVLVGRRS